MAPASPDPGLGPPAEQVALAFQRGESWAVEEVRRYVRRIQRFRGFAIAEDQLSDLEQETMVDLWRALARPEFDRHGGFWGFVGVVTTRRCIDWLRRYRQTLQLPQGLEDDAPSALEEYLRRERSDLARAVLTRLNQPCRELIHLHAGLQLSYREIGRRMRKGEGALRVQMHRCIQKAQEVLRELSREKASGLDQRERVK